MQIVLFIPRDKYQILSISISFHIVLLPFNLLFISFLLNLCHKSSEKMHYWTATDERHLACSLLEGVNPSKVSEEDWHANSCGSGGGFHDQLERLSI
jgi:hypothetical protein